MDAITCIDLITDNLVYVGAACIYSNKVEYTVINEWKISSAVFNEEYKCFYSDFINNNTECLVEVKPVRCLTIVIDVYKIISEDIVQETIKIQKKL